MPPESIWHGLYQGTVDIAIWVVGPVLAALIIWRFVGRCCS